MGWGMNKNNYSRTFLDKLERLILNGVSPQGVYQATLEYLDDYDDEISKLKQQRDELAGRADALESEIEDRDNRTDIDYHRSSAIRELLYLCDEEIAQLRIGGSFGIENLARAVNKLKRVGESMTNKQDQTSREAFEEHTIRKLKLRSPSADDEFVSHLMARSGEDYKLSVINDKWYDWQAATQWADR